MQDAKNKFEKEREQTLKALPDSVKQMFGQIGFVSSDDEEIALPVLIVSPYQVPPKPVRDIYWYDYFSKAKRAKKLSELAYLVYHYGHNDPDDYYSFVEQSDFVSYEQGLERGYHILPDGLAGKENLTEEEEIRVRGIAEMEEDVAKEPEERMRGAVGFQERHEQMKEAPPAAKRQKKS